MKTKCVALLLSLGLTLSTPALAANFSDVAPDAWYATAVQKVSDAGLMSGTGATTFAPGDTAARGMVATVLWRLMGSPIVEGDSFPDVADWYYYADAVRWAKSVGLMAGKSDGTFAGGDAITREQFAQVLYGYAKLQNQQIATGILDNYPDSDKISPWAVPAVGHAIGAGLLTGTTDGTWNPQGDVTRAELAVILQRLMTPVAG